MNKKNTVLLITPPYHSGVVESAGRWPNLGFVYIAGELEKAGFEVEIYDAMSKFHTYDQITDHQSEYDRRKDCNLRHPIFCQRYFHDSYNRGIRPHNQLPSTAWPFLISATIPLVLED